MLFHCIIETSYDDITEVLKVLKKAKGRMKKFSSREEAIQFSLSTDIEPTDTVSYSKLSR